MTQYLLAIELGPVVQIIAAARKTRDLYFGSWMLSEIAKAAAASVAMGCGDDGYEHLALVAPAPVDMNQLADESFSMGDEILALIPTGIDPAEVAKQARNAAHAKWIEFAKEAKGTGVALASDIWKTQTVDELSGDVAGEVVELYAAWVPLAGDYQASLKEVRRLLFGRNACRNFPPAVGRGGVPKSSLDGRRESVLRPGAKSRKLRLNEGEQLDALGVTKRVGQGQMNFPSTARLAAEPWIQGAQASPQFQSLVEACESLARVPSTSDKRDPILGRVATTGQFPCYQGFKPFPFEGTILYVTRHHEFVSELIDNEETQAAVTHQLKSVQAALKKVVSRYRDPGTYYVAMVADGDRIGEGLRKCRDAAAHREFSLRLSEFAGGVREIVDRCHGALIFAAGEDVSALLPLHTAVDCANRLRRSFDEIINGGHPERNATLSVGMVIGHFLDPLEETLAAARQMEVVAKQGDKNALAVQYRSRGGSPIHFRSSWEDEPHAELIEWQRLLQYNDLPDKVAYDIRRTAENYQTWSGAKDEEELRRRALQGDLHRLLTRKSSSANAVVRPYVERINAPQDAIDLANRIIIAGAIQRAQQQADGDAA
jgi:CRISPR-associated protein Cmr2